MIAGHTNIFAACSGTGCGSTWSSRRWQAAHRLGRSDVRAELVRLRFGQRAVRVAGHLADVPDRRRLTRSTLLGCLAGLLMAWTAWSSRCPGRDPGHLPDVLRAGRVRLRADRPGRIPGPPWPSGGAAMPAPAGAGSAGSGVRLGSAGAGGGRDLPRPRHRDQVGCPPGTSSGSGRSPSPGT